MTVALSGNEPALDERAPLTMQLGRSRPDRGQSRGARFIDRLVINELHRDGAMQGGQADDAAREIAA
jgi:hypothetical protein